jgi:hypothetical protein
MYKWILFALVTSSSLVLAQDVRDEDLGRQLANDSTQKAAVETIVASGRGKVPLLLKWTRTPPVQLDDIQRLIFRAGLADIFGRLKVEEAIPFLTENITQVRWPLGFGFVWKTPEAIEAQMPMVAALIQIGPAALDALVRAPYGPSVMEERLARIFVVSRAASTAQDKGRAIQFLREAAAEARLEGYWAGEGLKFIGAQ